MLNNNSGVAPCHVSDTPLHSTVWRKAPSYCTQLDFLSVSLCFLVTGLPTSTRLRHVIVSAVDMHVPAELTARGQPRSVCKKEAQ